MVIIASKSPLPVHMSLDEARHAVEAGAATIYASAGGDKGSIVFAVTGDMVLLPAFSARDALEQAGIRVRIVSIANPRRLYRPGDLGWNTVSEPDGRFMDDETFAGLFDGDALLAISGGPSATLEPVLLRSSVRRDVLCWQRGETVASPAELMHFNGVDAPAIEARAKALLGF